MSAATAAGLIYVIAPSASSGDAGGARRLEDLLLATAGESAAPAERRRCGATHWGWVPHAAGAELPGDRLTTACRGSRHAVLRGDPVWLEPWNARPCDAATLLEAWETDGAEAVRRLDNLSVALIADAATGDVQLATDRMGGFPLYRVERDGVTVLVTSYLVASRLALDRTIDGDAIAAFFHLGFFPALRTALRAVSLVPFASLATARPGSVAATPYWRPAMHVDRERPVAAQLEEVVAAFNATVREYAHGHDEMLLAMTAGYDSRTVAASLLHQRLPFSTYTHGFRGSPEVRGVERIVARHGIPHRYVPLEADFTARLGDLALASFRATEGAISCIEKCHLLHVQSALRAGAGRGTAVLLGGGAGMLKGSNYRLLRDSDRYTPGDVDGYLAWNFSKRLPAIFAGEVPATDPRVLRELVGGALEEAGGGSFFQRLDYLYAVRYRRWAGGVKHIYRRYFPVREPFVSARLLDVLFPLDPQVKGAKRPHHAILAHDFPALQYDLTNTLRPALPFNARTAWRFLPSLGWRAKQVVRGFSRRFLPKELFPLIDYVDYGRWIREPSGRELVRELLDPPRMKSLQLYGEGVKEWIRRWHEEGVGSFSLVDKMCTLELYFREIA